MIIITNKRACHKFELSLLFYFVLVNFTIQTPLWFYSPLLRGLYTQRCVFSLLWVGFRCHPDGEDYWSTNDPELIKLFLNSAGRGAKYYDFTGWDHATDTQFTSSLTYNDETGKYHMSYATVINGEITIIGKSFDANLKPVSLTRRGYPGAFVYDYAGGNGGLYQSAYNAAQYMELSSFATTLMSPFDPNSYYDGVSNWNVDETGRLVGINNVQLAKKGSGGKALAKILVKGFGNVSKNLFHRTIKPAILGSTGKSNYLGSVGKNPDITVIGGKIVLQGTVPGFTGKSYNTGLNANVFYSNSL